MSRYAPLSYQAAVISDAIPTHRHNSAFSRFTKSPFAIYAASKAHQ